MNLAHDPWIPVLYEDSSYTFVSLTTLYQDAEHIRDLAVNPAQRIALMRLLICITQAALDGPEDEEDWIQCRNRISHGAARYLKRHIGSFDLYGQTPFMQIPDLECRSGTSKPLGKLDCRSPFGGSTKTLFAREAIAQDRTISKSEKALNLLTFLNFSPSGKTGQSLWHGTQYSHATFASPCIKAAHTFIRGESILQTIHLNLLTKHGEVNGITQLPNGKWGKPAWEQFPKNVNDNEAFDNAAETYLGRLVPVSRFVKMMSKSSSECIAGPTHKSFSIQQLPAFREPSTTVSQNKKGKVYYVRISSSKHMWRELGAILSQNNTTVGQQGAIALSAVQRFPYLFDEQTVDIWVGGLEVGKQAALLNDMVEWVFSLPISMFGDRALEKYTTGVQLAESGENSLRGAVKSWNETMHVPKRQISYAGAKTDYWTQLDTAHEVLIKTVNETGGRLNDGWYQTVRDAMTHAYESVCPHETPRQIQAYAKGLRELRLKKIDE